MKEKLIKIADLEIHRIANTLPNMTEEQFERLKLDIECQGQMEPILIYRGAIVDGRHRFRALSELGEENIKAKTLPSTLSIGEVEDRVFSLETRRHETITQLAIYAWKMYHKQRESVEGKMSQTEVAKKCATNRRNLSRVETLYKVAGIDVIDHLYEGKLVNVGTKNRPIKSTSLETIINHYKKEKDEKLINDSNTERADLTDEEIASINDDVAYILDRNTNRMMKELLKRLYLEVKKLDIDEISEVADKIKENQINKQLEEISGNINLDD